MFINASLPEIYYIIKWIGEKHYVRYHLYQLKKKKLADDLNSDLRDFFVYISIWDDLKLNMRHLMKKEEWQFA